MATAGIQVLVVGEDADCFVQKVLKAEGWDVTTTDTSEAIAVIERQQPDLVVLHADRFGLGLDVCTALRTSSRVPVMVLSRSGSEEDVIAGLRSGADALVVEGVGPREFIARLRALMRRMPPKSGRDLSDTITVGPVILNRATRQVTANGRPVVMPRREFDILEVLMRDVDRTVTRDSLRRQLWGMSRDSRTLDVQVRRLRSRLADVEGGRRIVSVRGVGYRFTSTIEPTAPAAADVEIDLTKPRSSAPKKTTENPTRCTDGPPVTS